MERLARPSQGVQAREQGRAHFLRIDGPGEEQVPGGIEKEEVVDPQGGEAEGSRLSAM